MDFHQGKGGFEIMRVELEHAAIRRDRGVNRMQIGNVPQLELRIHLGQLKPGDRIIGGDIHEPLIEVFGLHIVILIKVRPAEIEEG